MISEPEATVVIRETASAARETDSCAWEEAAKAALTVAGRVLEWRTGISTENEEVGTEECFNFPDCWRVFLEGAANSEEGEGAMLGTASSPAPPGERSG
jgi:hypothetical protein